MRDRLILSSALICALLAVAAAFPSGARSADLGGNCCADLEERIAELEATTARKGNRKVTLEALRPGQRAIMYLERWRRKQPRRRHQRQGRTRSAFAARPRSTTSWEAGDRLEVGVRSINSKRFTQDDPKATPPTAASISGDSNWYLKSKTFGAVYLGLGTTATNAITEANLTQTGMITKFRRRGQRPRPLPAQRDQRRPEHAHMAPASSATAAINRAKASAP